MVEKSLDEEVTNKSKASSSKNANNLTASARVRPKLDPPNLSGVKGQGKESETTIPAHYRPGDALLALRLVRAGSV